MGNSFLSGLLAAVKSKMVPIVTKIKFFMTPQFWRTKVLSKFRDFLNKVFDVKPKDQNDYYGVMGYLVSKRLAYAIVLAIGILVTVYLVNLSSTIFPYESGAKTYKYNSAMLRFTTSDEVKIKAKSGYVAYVGAVNKGVVSGQGKLYDRDGNLVYQGEFDNNKYNGAGTSFYKNGNTTYKGNFVDNLYDGDGVSFRETGTMEYQGQFQKGLKNGQGILFGENGKEVYNGQFANDEIVYSKLVGMSAPEIKKAYTGKWTAFEDNFDYCVYLSDIDALYEGNNVESSVEDEVVAETVYVLKDRFQFGDKTCTSIKDLQETIGEPIYYGASEAILPEAVIINELSSKRTIFKGPINIDYEQLYDEYCKVSNYDSEYTLYLYSFEYDGMLYTFFCKDRDSNFEFYSIIKAEGGE